MSRVGRSTSTTKANSSRRGKSRSRKRRPHLRCPICHRVWASDWDGLCSHAVAVHGINLGSCPSIKELLELRAQKMSVMNASVQREISRSGEMDSEFCDLSPHYTRLEAAPDSSESFQDGNIRFELEVTNQKFDSERRGILGSRNVRSMSDFGVVPNSDCEYPSERCNVTIIPSF